MQAAVHAAQQQQPPAWLPQLQAQVAALAQAAAQTQAQLAALAQAQAAAQTQAAAQAQAQAAAQAQTQALLDALAQQVAKIQLLQIAVVSNSAARRHNRKAHQPDSLAFPLQPLVLDTDNAAGDALNTQPPAGAFPQTLVHVRRLTNAQLDVLQVS